MKEGRYPFPNQRDGKDNHQLNIEFHALLLKILERYTNSLLLFYKKSSIFRKFSDIKDKDDCKSLLV